MQYTVPYGDVAVRRLSQCHPVRLLPPSSTTANLPAPPGHCVTPQMGQGCNSALEDCVLLARALEGADYDVTAGLTAYDKKRAPQVCASSRPLWYLAVQLAVGHILKKVIIEAFLLS